VLYCPFIFSTYDFKNKRKSNNLSTPICWLYLWQDCQPSEEKWQSRELRQIFQINAKVEFALISLCVSQNVLAERSHFIKSCLYIICMFVWFFNLNNFICLFACLFEDFKGKTNGWKSRCSQYIKWTCSKLLWFFKGDHFCLKNSEDGRLQCLFSKSSSVISEFWTLEIMKEKNSKKLGASLDMKQPDVDSPEMKMILIST